MRDGSARQEWPCAAGLLQCLLQFRSPVRAGCGRRGHIRCSHAAAHHSRHRVQEGMSQPEDLIMEATLIRSLKGYTWVLIMGSFWETAAFAVHAAGALDQQQIAYGGPNSH